MSLIIECYHCYSSRVLILVEVLEITFKIPVFFYKKAFFFPES